jgi:hypothetical protein
VATGHKDYSGTPLSKKLGIKEGSRVMSLGAPRTFPALLGKLPRGAKLSNWEEVADVIVLFAQKGSELRKWFGNARKSLDPSGRLWVAYPKKTSKLTTDLTFESVQNLGLQGGLVDNKSCAIDDDWSGVQFVYRLKDRPGAGKG